MQSLHPQKHPDGSAVATRSTQLPQQQAVSDLELVDSRAEILVELRARFADITQMELPPTLQETRELGERLQDKIKAISRAHAILDNSSARWYEPIRTGWITDSEQLDRVIKRNPGVYYPFRVLAEMAQPLNLLVANMIISAARGVGTSTSVSSAASPPELSVPILVGGSILATLGLTMLYRTWGRHRSGSLEALSNPNAIAGSLTAKATDVIDNSRLNSIREGRLPLRDDPEIAAHAALRWHKDAEIRMAKIAETRNGLNAHHNELREALEILEVHRHMSLAHEEFHHHATDLGFSDISPDQALSKFAGALASAPEELRQRVCDWLYHFVSSTEESKVLLAAAPDFLKAGPHANAEMVRTWKLFVHALNIQEPQTRPGTIYAVLNALEELQGSHDRLQSS